MNIELGIVLSVLFVAIAWIGSIVRINRRKKYDLVDWFMFSMGFFHGVAYIFVLEMRTYPSNKYDFWIVPLLGIIAIVGTWIGAGFIRENKDSFNPVTVETALNIRKLIIIAWVFLIFSIICYWIYVKPYGGFVKFLEHSWMIRAGLQKVLRIDNPYSFLSKFGGFAILSSLIFFSNIIYRQKASLKIINVFSFLTSFLISLYVLYSWRGRVFLILYLTIFPLAYIFSKNLFGYKIIFKSAILILLAMFSLLPLTQIMTPNKEKSDPAEFFLRELSFPSYSILRFMEKGKLRYGVDIIQSPLYLLPQKLWYEKWGLDTASDDNTERILGGRKGEKSITTSVPVDFITFGLSQLGISGVFIISILWGMLLKYLNKILYRIKYKALQSVMYAYSVLFVSMLTSVYADPEHVIVRNFHFIIGLIPILIVSRNNEKYRDRNLVEQN